MISPRASPKDPSAVGAVHFISNRLQEKVLLWGENTYKEYHWHQEFSIYTRSKGNNPPITPNQGSASQVNIIKN